MSGGLGAVPDQLVRRAPAPGAVPGAPPAPPAPGGAPMPPGGAVGLGAAAPPPGMAPVGGGQGLSPEQRAAILGSQGIMQPDGSMVFAPPPQQGPAMDPTDAGSAPEMHKANLVEQLPPSVLSKIGAHVCEAVEEDIRSNEESYAAWREGLKLLGLQVERLSNPFEGASGAVHPMLKQAVVAFVATANGEMCPASGPVRCETIGDTTPDLERKAQRKQGWLNYYLTAVDEGFYPDNDQGWLMLALYGSIFRKVFRDPLTGQPRSRFLTPLNLILSYNSEGVDSGRATQADGLSRVEVRRRQLAGYYADVPLGSPSGEESEQQKVAAESEKRRPSTLPDDADHLVYECWLLLAPGEFGWQDPMAIMGGPAPEGVPPPPEGAGGVPGVAGPPGGAPPPPPVAPGGGIGGLGTPPAMQMGQPVPDDYPLPYVVTVDADSRQVLRMERGWRQGDPLFRTDGCFSHYRFMPGLGVYGWGLLALMAAQTDTASTLLRQALNAFTLASFPGGFKSKGINQEKSDIEIGPMQFAEIETGGLKISDVIMPLVYRDVPPSFVPLLDNVQKGGEALGQISLMQVGEGRQDAPVGTTLALIEQAMRPTGAVMRRLHVARRRELRLVARKFGEAPGATYPYLVAGKRGAAMAADFRDADDVLPVSDPNIPTQVQRLALADAKLRMAMQSNGVMDVKVALRSMLRTMGTPDDEIDALMPEKKAGQPADVVTEFAWALSSTPLAVGPAQAHEAHLVAHLGQLQTPNLPPPVLQALMAHAGEHLAALYASMASIAAGMPVIPGQPLPPEIEARVAMAVAQSTEQIMAPIAAAMAGAAQDPNKRAEMAFKDKELQFKALDGARKSTEAARQDQVEVMTAQEETNRARLDAQIRELEGVIGLVTELVKARGGADKALIGERTASVRGQQQERALLAKALPGAGDAPNGGAAVPARRPAAKAKAKATEGRVG